MPFSTTAYSSTVKHHEAQPSALQSMVSTAMLNTVGSFH